MKRYSLLLLSLVAVFILSSCAGPQQSEKFTVYLSDSLEAGSVFYPETAQFNMKDDIQSTEISPPWQIAFPVGNDTVNLQHYQTINNHQYRSEDNSIRCSLDKNTGALRQVIIEGPQYLPGFSLTDQESFESFIKQFISIYYEEDWNQYTASCTTYRRNRGDNSAQSENADEVHLSESENEKGELESYDLTYVRKIDGHTTSDYIYASYSATTNRLTITFSNHSFDNVDTITLDTEGINKSIGSFIRSHVDSSRFDLQRYTLTDPIVSRRGDQLYYGCSVTLYLQVRTATGETRDAVRFHSIIAETGIDVSHVPVGAPSKPYQVLVAEKPADYAAFTEPTETATAGTPADLGN